MEIYGIISSVIPLPVVKEPSGLLWPLTAAFMSGGSIVHVSKCVASAFLPWSPNSTPVLVRELSGQDVFPRCPQGSPGAHVTAHGWLLYLFIFAKQERKGEHLCVREVCV